MGNRFDIGCEMLEQVDGQEGITVIESLADIAPDIGRFIVEFAFGDIYARDDLSLRERELITISSLCTQGAADPQLKVHVRGALNVGVLPEEVIGAFIQCIPYVGFPRVLNAVSVARAVFEESNCRIKKETKLRFPSSSAM